MGGPSSCIDQSHVACSEQAPAVANRDALPRRQSPWQPCIVGCCRNRRWPALTLSLLLARRVRARARDEAQRGSLEGACSPCGPMQFQHRTPSHGLGNMPDSRAHTLSLHLSSGGWEQLCGGITQEDLGPCRTRSPSSLEPESHSRSVGSSSLPCSSVAYAASPTRNIPPQIC